MARPQYLVACLALLCLTGSSFGRVLQQLDATAAGPASSLGDPTTQTPVGRLAPTPASALPLAPTPALSGTPLVRVPGAGPTSLPSGNTAQAPLPVAQACYVSWQAKINQQTATSSNSVDSPACVVVFPNMPNQQCQALQTQGRTVLATGDPACIYPVPEDCSGVVQSMPGLNQCDQRTTQAIQNAAQQHSFDDVVLKNTPIGSSTPGFASPFGNMNMNFPMVGNPFANSNPFSGNPFMNTNPFG